MGKDGEWGVTAGCEISFRGDENIMELSSGYSFTIL